MIFCLFVRHYESRNVADNRFDVKTFNFRFESS